MSREQTVRDVAYAIWEAEGKPEGRDAAHWQQAEARVARSPAQSEKTGAKTASAKTAGGKTAGAPIKTASLKKTHAEAGETKAVGTKAKASAKGRASDVSKDAPAAKQATKATAPKVAPKK